MYSENIFDYNNFLDYFSVKYSELYFYILLVILFVILVIVIISFVSLFKIFKKVGEKGWKALIPLYNLYLMFKRWSKTTLFWLSLGAYILNFAIKYIDGMIDIFPIHVVFFFLGLCLFAFLFVMFVILFNNMSRSFGHGGGFTVGLLLLNCVFLAILAFGPSKYKPLK